MRTDEQDAAPWGLDAKLAVVGTDVPRVDGWAKASGSAKYTYDVYRPGMAFAALAGLPARARARASVGPRRREAAPGRARGEAARRRRGDATPARRSRRSARETETALDDAIAAIRVEYEVLPHVVDTMEAAAADAPRVDPEKDNRQGGGRPQGDAERALAAAEVKVVGRVPHGGPEPRPPSSRTASVAEFDGDGGLTVWCSTQGVGGIRADIAQRQRIARGEGARDRGVHGRRLRLQVRLRGLRPRRGASSRRRRSARCAA